MWRFIFAFVFIVMHQLVYSQENNERSFIVQNEKLLRKIVVKNGRISTAIYLLKGYPYNFVSTEKEETLDFGQAGISETGEFKRWKGQDPDEFSFLLNGEEVTGKTGWNVLDVTEQSLEGTVTHQVVLKGTAAINRDVELTITYVIYPELPVIRKK